MMKPLLSIRIQATKLFSLLFMLCILCSLFSTTSMAQTKTYYVSDEITVPMRRGFSDQYKVRAPLKSGTMLTLIEINEKTGYSKVVTAKGTEGWIESKYLSSNPGSKIRLEKALRDLASIKEKLGTIQEQAKLTSGDNKALNQKINSLSQRNKDLTSELASIKKISSNAINIDRNNRELLKVNELLKIDLAELQSENARLSDDSDKEWFIRGAFAVLIGVVIAILAPRFKPRKKSTEWV